jgi:hypothetical protein
VTVTQKVGALAANLGQYLPPQFIARMDPSSEFILFRGIISFFLIYLMFIIDFDYQFEYTRSTRTVRMKRHLIPG